MKNYIMKSVFCQVIIFKNLYDDYKIIKSGITNLFELFFNDI